ncbi:hypothetical protein WAF17_13760 [Bernardetia sp. ABR2-2B]|uniref:hypothetical protein n=1 Tax=Bernardetia sp. ABR2-2B TaxID=3127472 RepID=UPI0030D3F246
MEILKHFETYIDAQKATGMQFVIFGILLLVAAIVLHFSQLNPITLGLRNGFFVISILLIASGVGFTLNQNKLLKTKIETYQTNKKEFEQQEIDRMQQVNKSVPKIIITLSIVLILLVLALIFFIHPPFWKGVSFSVAIYLLGLLILESISFLSVKNYLESLLN